MGSKSTATVKRGKVSRPKKPYRDFPLMFHASGRFAKKIGGNLHYFGRWANVQNGTLTPVDSLDDAIDAAVKLYDLQRDDLQAGHKPQFDPNSATIGQLCFAFLGSRKAKLNAGELSRRSLDDYEAVCGRLEKQFGKLFPLKNLSPATFRTLRSTFSKGNGPVTVGNLVQRTRTIFRFAYSEGLVEHPVRFGDDFRRPSAKVLRLARHEKGPRLLQADELRLVLKALTGAKVKTSVIDAETGKPATVTLRKNPVLRSMILLALNTGFGQTDIANLPRKAIDLDAGWIRFPRVKTGIARRSPLWKETVSALREAIPLRPDAKTTEDEELVYLTRTGKRWTRTGITTGSWVDCVGGEFDKVLKSLGLKRPGISFYCLRHVVQTVGENAKDFPALQLLMGHADNSMSGVYREEIDDSRLVAVTDAIRAWLFPPTKKTKPRAK